jgi:hypothetical protein
VQGAPIANGALAWLRRAHYCLSQDTISLKVNTLGIILRSLLLFPWDCFSFFFLWGDSIRSAHMVTIQAWYQWVMAVERNWHWHHEANPGS